MTRAWILMAAMPPTQGHLNLIRFSCHLAPTTVLVCTQPDEPYAIERYKSIAKTAHGVDVRHFHKQIEQNPDAPGFWQMWKNILDSYGFRSGDYIVASEIYGKRLADEVGGIFMPYDLDRSIYPCKATYARIDPLGNWETIIPEFRNTFVQTVTLFGAESVGKTTMAQGLAKFYDAEWTFEWARPYLEAVGPDVTNEKMIRIWKGQYALQRSTRQITKSPVIFQDTDLFSTVGYWEMYEPGNVPDRIVRDATIRESDLYLICLSNIPFVQDQLRYGGDKRESDDQYWIDLCEQYGLNYKVLTASRPGDRLAEATGRVDQLLKEKINFNYDRQYN